VVKIRREGDAVAPVEMVLSKDGSVELLMGRAVPLGEVHVHQNCRSERVVIDPQGKYFMDVNWSTRATEADKAQTARWLSNIVLRQNAAIWIGAFRKDE
jgi:hypothetical protein